MARQQRMQGVAQNERLFKLIIIFATLENPQHDNCQRQGHPILEMNAQKRGFPKQPMGYLISHSYLKERYVSIEPMPSKPLAAPLLKFPLRALQSRLPRFPIVAEHGEP